MYKTALYIQGTRNVELQKHFKIQVFWDVTTQHGVTRRRLQPSQRHLQESEN
jgi:hypothetical protein